MLIKIQNREYKLNSSAITCIRYRKEYGHSIIEDLKKCERYENIDMLSVILERIIYIASNSQMNFNKFKKVVRADKNFLESALTFLSELFKSSEKNSFEETIKTTNNEKFDEFKLIAVLAECNVPDFLLNELTIFQLAEVITETINLKQPSKKGEKYRQMSNKEMKALYGI